MNKTRRVPPRDLEIRHAPRPPPRRRGVFVSDLGPRSRIGNAENRAVGRTWCVAGLANRRDPVRDQSVVEQIGLEGARRSRDHRERKHGIARKRIAHAPDVEDEDAGVRDLPSCGRAIRRSRTARPSASRT